MTEIICVGRPLSAVASLFPSINPLRLDTAPMRHSLCPSRTRSSGGGRTGMPVHTRSTMRRADRRRNTLRRSRRPKHARDDHLGGHRPFLSLSSPCFCLRQKTIRLRRTCGLHSLPGARSYQPVLPAAPQRPALTSPLGFRPVNSRPRITLSSLLSIELHFSFSAFWI
jgi:hypothetical protein